MPFCMRDAVSGLLAAAFKGAGEPLERLRAVLDRP